MVWQFIRLKFRLTGRLNGAGDAWSLVGLIFLWLVAVVVGLGSGALLAVAARFIGEPAALAALAGGLIQLAWILVPVVGSALDSTLNPRWFELLPISPPDLGRGLLAAGAVGPGGLATVLVASVGFGAGYWPGWWGIVTVPVLVVLATVIGVATGRLVVTMLSDLLSRGRGEALGPLIGVGISFVSIALTTVGFDSGLAAGLPRWVEWLAVLPGGSVGLAAAALDQRRWSAAALTLAWAVVTAIALVRAHGWAVERMQTRAATTRPGRARRRDTGTLGGRLAPLIPSGPVRVAAAKEWRYLRRDPRLRAQILGSVASICILGFVGVNFLTGPYAPFLAVGAAWAAVTALVPNQFGPDGGSFWAYVVSPTDVAVALAGKNALWALSGAAVAMAAEILGAVLGGTAAYLPAALMASVTVLLVWMAVGNLTSIFGAFPLPERQVMSSGAKNGRAVVVSLVGLAVSSALTLPAAVALGLAMFFAGALATTLAALAGVCYAVLLFRFAYRWARSEVFARRLILVEVLDRP